MRESWATRFAGQVPAPFAIYQPPVAGGGLMPFEVGIASLQLVDLDSLRSVEALADYRREVTEEIGNINAEYAGLPLPEEKQTEFADLQKAHTEASARITELEARQAYIEGLASGESHREAVPQRIASAIDGALTSRDARGSMPVRDLYDPSTLRASSPLDPFGGNLEIRDRALKIIEKERFPHPLADQDKVRKAVFAMVDREADDPFARDMARHIFLTGSPAYQRAWTKAVFGGVMTGEEQTAYARVTQFRAAMTLGTDTAGGAVAPFQLDPTIIPTSDGAINPLRTISRLARVIGKAWQGVTSAGVTAGRSAEGAESGDDSPTLAQPEVPTSKVDVFIPFSIELGLAWGSIREDLAVVLQDAKDEEEAESFINGDGVAPNPSGLIQTLADTSIIWTQASNAFAVEDIYALEHDTATGVGGNGLPPRFRPRSSILGNGSVFARTRQFDTSGGASLWVQLADGNPPTLVGRRAYEMSTMDGSIANGNDILVQGDFRYFIIVDRVGMTIELIPHLFHTGNNRPSGQRGLYAHWHNGSEILSSNAFRKLRVGEGS